ncbi:Tn3 family transposase [Pseudovibrio sp. Tun.PSC04-5.I4]|uniref:Tn3 family transposase n=1 Tax=Pseudovibrio sp. Tun.PSC04-5.I4 TaxID=1798213 RepID=UPI0013566CF8|nr:Tn3 family transposase [Pseudovibrio sp. Tun.PSC04-5.I4]
MRWLRGQSDWSKATMKAAPTSVVSKSWQPYVLDSNGQIADPSAYVLATIDAWHKAIKRRDVLAVPEIRYADLRIGVLERRKWQNTKGIVCRSLNRTLDGPSEVKRLTELLDATYARVVARVDQNPDLKSEDIGGKRRIGIAAFDRMDEQDSLIAARKQVHNLMPKGGIPDILLEVMHCTGFAQAFTHISGKPAQIENFETSLCAVLVAQTCAISLGTTRAKGASSLAAKPTVLIQTELYAHRNTQRRQCHDRICTQTTANCGILGIWTNSFRRWLAFSGS